MVKSIELETRAGLVSNWHIHQCHSIDIVVVSTPLATRRRIQISESKNWYLDNLHGRLWNLTLGDYNNPFLLCNFVLQLLPKSERTTHKPFQRWEYSATPERKSWRQVLFLETDWWLSRVLNIYKYSRNNLKHEKQSLTQCPQRPEGSQGFQGSISTLTKKILGNKANSC